MTKKRKKPPIVDWEVNIGMNVTEDVHVKARTESEARKKAWGKWRAKKKHFDVWANKM